MTQKYYAIVTSSGAAMIANAAALGLKLNITQMAVGDGGGALPTPNASQTKLVNETRRAALNALSVDPDNASQIIAEQIIPETEGGFWIREMGLYSEDGTLIAVCNTPETYKPALQEGSGRTQTVRMILIVNSTDTITLKIDPSVVLATRKYVDDSILTVRQYASKLLADHVSDLNPHDQYLLTENALAEIGGDNALLTKLFLNLGLGTAAGKDVGTDPGQIPDMSAWKFVKSSDGTKWALTLPNGFLLQKVSANPASVSTLVTSSWLVPYPAECLGIWHADGSSSAVNLDSTAAGIISVGRTYHVGFSVSTVQTGALGGHDIYSIGY
ncbi:phage tail protein [Erwinia typographi]|uniref:phage tail protein n=1 Tax=Erwinia typographi TaxID=371042 RepID=UPI000ACBED24|nr:phage tail protein [Erwinia typographi]